MRRALAILVTGSVLVVTGIAASAPGAIEARSCRQLSTTFNVQIVGDKDAVHWFGSADSRPSLIPDRRTAVVVWSYGGPASAGGLAVYGWVVGARSHLSSRCSSVKGARKPSRGKLGDPVAVKDGWFTGRRFLCLRRGPLVVETRDVAAGKRLRVWMERTGELIALGEVRARNGWLRGSETCSQRER